MRDEVAPAAENDSGLRQFLVAVILRELRLRRRRERGE